MCISLEIWYHNFLHLNLLLKKVKGILSGYLISLTNYLLWKSYFVKKKSLNLPGRRKRFWFVGGLVSMPEIPTKNIFRSGPVHCSRSTSKLILQKFSKTFFPPFSLISFSLSFWFKHYLSLSHTHTHTHTHTLFSLTLKLTKHNQKLVWSFTARKIIYLVPTTICHFTQLS